MGLKFDYLNSHLKKYSYNKNEYFLKKGVETYINIEKIYNENKVSIAATQPELIEIQYTII